MREFLFRGKRKDNGDWVYGYYEKYNDGSYINLQTDRLNSGGYPIREFIEIIPETVGQYTGLTDKNGKKIFEGDIVKDPWRISKVEYYRGCYYPFISFPEYSCWDTDETEVIGNVYDNPELWKVIK